MEKSAVSEIVKDMLCVFLMRGGCLFPGLRFGTLIVGSLNLLSDDGDISFRGRVTMSFRLRNFLLDQLSLERTNYQMKRIKVRNQGTDTVEDVDLQRE